MTSKNGDSADLSATALVSPGLYRGSEDGAAFEIKYLLPDAQATLLEERLRQELRLDPHADPALGDAYRVTSLYFDTPEFDTFRRRENFSVQKYRIRRYGDSTQVYLERKNKSAHQVHKLRTAVDMDDLAGLLATAVEPHPAEWFVRQVAEKSLRPVCAVTYQRTALIGANGEGPIRATFDRRATGRAATDWEVDRFDSGAAILEGEVIVELKFLLTIPELFQSAVNDLQLLPSRVSKYRRCIRATGQAPATLAVDPGEEASAG